MGKFDGYLICSDLDGTFLYSETETQNAVAIRYFTENGGRFTFATGRAADHLRQRDLLPLINAPACLCNGSLVYDYSTETVLKECRVDFPVGSFLRAIQGTPEPVHRLDIMLPEKEGGHMYFDDLNAVPAKDQALQPYKLICRFETPEKADIFKAFALNQPFFSGMYIAKSWPLGVEFNAGNGTKGHALKFIKSHLGNIHTAIGIGDFENDLPLIQHADLGVAVANAVPAVREAAQMIVCHFREYAIKDLIERLEKTL